MQSTCCILKDADQSTGKSALVDLEFQNSKVQQITTARSNSRRLWMLAENCWGEVGRSWRNSFTTAGHAWVLSVNQ